MNTINTANPPAPVAVAPATSGDSTLKELLDNPANRQADGSLNDAAYAAYKFTQAAHPDGFVPEDELDTTPVVGAPANSGNSACTCREAAAVAFSRGAHHLRLLAGEEVVADTALAAGEAVAWTSGISEAAWAVYNRLASQSQAIRWAACALHAALAAAEEMLSAAVAAGALTFEMKVGEVWEAL